MYLAFRNLTQDKVRLCLSVLGVALAVMLILFLFGLRAGIFRAAVMYLDNAPGSVVLLPEGSRSTSASSGQFLPPGTADAVAQMPGVGRVTPLLLIMAMPEFHGRKEAIRLVGYDATLGGGPWDLARGREPQRNDEVVLDRVLADRHGFRIGEVISVSGSPLTVVGLSNGTSSWTGSYVFARKALVEGTLLTPGATNVILVTPAAQTSSNDLIRQLRDIPGASVLLKNDVMANDQQIIAGIADQVIMLMVTAAFIVGTLVVGMVIYTATLERRSEYGILKAIGARNSRLYRVVVWQAVAAAGLGAIAGVGFAFVMGWLVMTVRPQFLVQIESAAIGATLAAGLVMALTGGLVPARSVTRVAPAEVFRR